MGHLFGLKSLKNIKYKIKYKITMVTTPQLPFDLISIILQERKNILQEQRQIKETKNNVMCVVDEIYYHARLPSDDYLHYKEILESTKNSNYYEDWINDSSSDEED